MRPLLPLLALLLLLAGGPTATARDEGKPLDELFHAAVALEGKTVTLRYDLAAADQALDWRRVVAVPPDPDAFAADAELADGALLVPAEGGLQHVARWKGEVRVTCTLTPTGDGDVGGYLAGPADDADWAAFVLVERTFHGAEGQPGGTHAIVKLSKAWRKRGLPEDAWGFRWVARRAPPPRIEAGQPVAFGFGLARGRLHLTVGDLTLDERDEGRALKPVAVGFRDAGGQGARVKDVTIAGHLDPAWLESVGGALRLATPPDEGR